MLTESQERSLIALLHLMVDQQRARVIVPPQQPASEFWFGGGNLVSGPDGALYLAGRYRNHGDSRTGVAAGTRGLELALFQSQDGGRSFEKVLHFSKSDLDLPERPVLSIEGCALRFSNRGVELFVSTEKDGIGYPNGFTHFLKPGTGVWTIDYLQAATIEELKQTRPQLLVQCRDPRYIHVKDPFLYEHGPQTLLLFCSHPFSWTSSNTGYLPLPADGATRLIGPPSLKPTFEFFPRGVTWDVAMSRGTCLFDVPQLGLFANRSVTVMFYDGGECVRNLDEHTRAVKRPRGYSCEELGGAAYCIDGNLQQWQRLSRYEPLFVSPHGTGCSRYVDVHSRPEGLYVTWQQSQPDGSQPLVMNFVPADEVAAVLAR